MQLKLTSFQNEIETLLSFHEDIIEPKKYKMRDALIEIVKILYDFYENQQRLSKKDRKVLKELILIKIDQVFSLSPFNDDDPEIRRILKDLDGVDYEDIISGEFDGMKSGLNEIFQEMGLDIDMPEFDSADNEQDIFRKFAHAMADAKKKIAQGSIPKPKSKKELEKELKAQKLEALQKQGINGIYKQLAKVFHPDLEQDPVLRPQKVELMKKLTSAYEAKDLFTLLSLEMEWLNREDSQGKEQNESQLKIYNSLLKDQVETLQSQIDMVMMNPRYFPLQRYNENSTVKLSLILKKVNDEIDHDLKYWLLSLKDLEGENRTKYIKEIIKQCS